MPHGGIGSNASSDANMSFNMKSLKTADTAIKVRRDKSNIIL